MHREHRLGINLGKFVSQGVAICADRVDLPAELGEARAFADRLGEALELAFGFGETPGDDVSAGDALAAIVGQYAMKLAQEFGDDVGRKHVPLKRAQYAPLKLGIGDGAAVVAAATLPLAATAPGRAGDDRIAAPTHSAAHEAGQQLPGANLAMRGHVRETIEAPLGRVPGRGVYDRQLGHLGNAPFALGVEARLALAGDRVLLEALAVVDDPTGIERIVQDAGAAATVAGDRRRAPLPPGWRRHAVAVELLGRALGTEPGKMVGEDAPDDRGLLGIDRAHAAIRPPLRVQRRHEIIAVAQTTGDAPSLDAADLPAARFLAELLEVERRHRAAQADVDLADLAFGERDETNAGVAQALPDRGDVLLVAADAVDRFSDDDVVCLGLVEQTVEAGPVAARAGEREIGEHVHYVPALARGAITAQPRLVLSGSFGLLVARVAGVDRCARHRGAPGRVRGQDALLPPRAQARGRGRAARAR